MVRGYNGSGSEEKAWEFSDGVRQLIPQFNEAQVNEWINNSRRFAAPVLAVCGFSGSGKTTLLEAAIPRLLSRGLRVAVVKHDAHGFDVDRPGKDSDRLFRAGATVALSGAGQQFERRAAALPLPATLARLACDHDLLLVEGHKDTALPKFWLAGADGLEAPNGVANIVGTLPWDVAWNGAGNEPSSGAHDSARLVQFMDYIERWLPQAWAARPLYCGLLIGGSSSRMGEPKQLLRFGELTLAEIAVQALAFRERTGSAFDAVGEAIVLGSGTLPESLRALVRLPDAPGFAGPGAALIAAHRWAPEAAWIVAACDHPWLRHEHIQWLAGQRQPGSWAVIPRQSDGHPCPTLALYEPQALAALERQAQADSQHNARAFALLALPATQAPELPAAMAEGWINVNTPEELSAANEVRARQSTRDNATNGVANNAASLANGAANNAASGAANNVANGVTYDAALRIILENATPSRPESVELLESLGTVLAEDVTAPWPLPSFSNSAMDGYAVRAADCLSNFLPIIDYVAAGARATKAVLPGTAIRIMTGAPLPDGCDAVVPFEEAEEANNAVRVKRPVTVHQNIRFAGEDVAQGETILTAGTALRPYEINMLASCAKQSVAVFRRPTVAIVSTGDELIELGQAPTGQAKLGRALPPGKIVNSNSYALAAAVRNVGARPLLLGIARDNLPSHREKLAEGLKADVLITCAGVSVGDRDLVREVLQELGVQLLFWQVKVKPGKAMAFGVKDGKPVFALPGNPVSATLTFEEFVAPALLKMMGHRQVLKPLLPAVLQSELRKRRGELQLLRVRLEYSEGRYLAWSAGKQDSSRQKTSLRANALALLPADRDFFAAGDEIQVHLLDTSAGMHSL
jgi:molybdopterin molybdotransferase